MNNNLKLAARAGNPKAIEQLIAKVLKSQDITVQVVRTDTKLSILLSSEATPDSRLVHVIKKGLDKIRPQRISTVTVRAQNVFSTRIAWTQQWYIASSSTQHQSTASTSLHSDESKVSISSSISSASSHDTTNHSSIIKQATTHQPKAIKSTSHHIWRSNNLLVMRKDAQLLDRCIKTNQPAYGKRYKLELQWTPRWLWLFLGITWLWIAIFLSEKITVNVGITATQWKKFRRRVFWGWITTALGLVLWSIPLIISVDQYFEWSEWTTILGLFLFFLGPFISLVIARPIGIVQIKGDFIWLRGVSKDYLNCLPSWEPDNQKQDAKVARINFIKPWHRCEARFFDSLLANILLIFFLAIIAPSILELLASGEVSYRLDCFMVVSFNAILLEPILLCSWGTTPGKALLGIQVRQRNGEKLTYLQAMNRSISVGFGGMALGLYPISFLAMFLGYQKLTQTGITIWDQTGGFIVFHRKISKLRRIIRAFVIHIFVLFAMASILIITAEVLNSLAL